MPNDTTYKELLLRLAHLDLDDLDGMREIASEFDSMSIEADPLQGRVLSQAAAICHEAADEDRSLEDATDGVWRLVQTISEERIPHPEDMELGIAEGTPTESVTPDAPAPATPVEAAAPPAAPPVAAEPVVEEPVVAPPPAAPVEPAVSTASHPDDFAPSGADSEPPSVEFITALSDTSTPSLPVAIPEADPEEVSMAEAAAPAQEEVPEMPATVVVREDDDLIVECAEESAENLSVAENAILELEEEPSNADLVDTVFRSFHTIKGIAGFLDLQPISLLAHRAESLLAKVRSKEHDFCAHASTTLLQAVDCLGRMLNDLRRGEQADGSILVHVPDTWAAVYASIGTPGPANGAPVTPVAAAPSPAAAPAESAVDPAGESDEAAKAQDAEQAAEAPAPAAPPTKSDAKSKPARDAFVRVRTDRLDQLLDAVGELVIAQTMVSDRAIRIVDSTDLAESITHAGKIVRELQDLSMSLRMVPMASTFQRMSRVARDVASKRGRRVKMATGGEDTEIDRNLVDLLSEPLIHMIRNAVDHGIETPEERVAVGKDPVGVVTLTAAAEAGRIVVRIQDDGKGLDPEKLIAKARKNGILGPEERVSDADAYRLIFHAGFSTAEKVTSVSGRGVGMDVVRRNVEVLGGRVHVDSELGKGTVFSIYVPLTLAITDGMIVGVADERYILPTLSIMMSFKPRHEILANVPGRGEVVMVRGEPIPLVRLHEIFDIQGACSDPTEALLVIMADGEHKFALLVDEVVGQHQVVTKALELGSQPVTGLGGAAILGDGRVGLIVDPAGMARRAQTKLHLSESAPLLH